MNNVNEWWMKCDWMNDEMWNIFLENDEWVWILQTVSDKMKNVNEWWMKCE